MAEVKKLLGFPLPASLERPLAPGLYVVATPIGNLGDITLRALAVLNQADFILCEDSRVSGKLLAAYGIDTPLKPYHDHNGAQMRPLILEALTAQKKIALISDAGTPLISDPGYKLVRLAQEAGHSLFTVPGASALTAALSIAGLPTDQFLFTGFLPAKPHGRRKALKALLAEPRTLVIYESGPRLPAMLADIAAIHKQRHIAICRELTKRYENVTHGSAAALAEEADGSKIKGEIVLLVEGAHPDGANPDEVDAIDPLLRQAMAEMSIRDAVAFVAAQSTLGRKQIYQRALLLRKERPQTNG